MHGKLHTVVGAVLGCMLVVSLSGCGKAKQPQQGKGAAQASQLAKEPAAADTGDIFKEFYAEDSSAKKGKAGAKKAGKQAAAAEQKPAASSFSGEFSENGRYTVQVSCVKSQSFANSMVAKLKDKGFPAYVAEVQNPTPNLSGTFFRVRIGGFKVVADAKSFGQNTLAADGYEFWVDKKSNDNVGMEGYGLGSGGGSAAGSYQSAPAPSATPSPSSSGSTESSFSTTPPSGTESSGSSSFSGSSSSQSSSSFSTTPSSGSSSSQSGTGTTSGSTSGSSSFSSEPSTSGASGSSAESGSTGSAGASSSPSTGSSTGTSGTQGTGTTGSGKDSSSGGW